MAERKDLGLVMDWLGQDSGQEHVACVWWDRMLDIGHVIKVSRNQELKRTACV